MRLQGPAFGKALSTVSQRLIRKQYNKQMRATTSSVQLQLVAGILSETVLGHHTLWYRLMLKLSKPVTRQMLTVSLPPGSTASATSSMSSARQANFRPCCTHTACEVHDVIQQIFGQCDQDTVLDTCHKPYSQHRRWQYVRFPCKPTVVAPC